MCRHWPPSPGSQPAALEVSVCHCCQLDEPYKFILVNVYYTGSDLYVIAYYFHLYVTLSCAVWQLNSPWSICDFLKSQLQFSLMTPTRVRLMSRSKCSPILCEGKQIAHWIFTYIYIIIVTLSSYHLAQ